jgi:hypothetical protein
MKEYELAANILQLHGGVPESHLNCCGCKELCPTAEKQTNKEIKKGDRNLKTKTERRDERVRYKK